MSNSDPYQKPWIYLNFSTGMRETVQTKIKLLIEEHSDLKICIVCHCPCIFWRHFSTIRSLSANDYSKILDVQQCHSHLDLLVLPLRSCLISLDARFVVNLLTISSAVWSYEFTLFTSTPHCNEKKKRWLFHYTNIMQYTAIFHSCKNGNFQMKKCNIFSSFCSKHRSLVHVRTASLR